MSLQLFVLTEFECAQCYFFPVALATAFKFATSDFTFESTEAEKLVGNSELEVQL